jgi:hypothetical protein
MSIVMGLLVPFDAVKVRACPTGAVLETYRFTVSEVRVVNVPQMGPGKYTETPVPSIDVCMEQRRSVPLKTNGVVNPRKARFGVKAVIFGGGISLKIEAWLVPAEVVTVTG